MSVTTQQRLEAAEKLLAEVYAIGQHLAVCSEVPEISWRLAVLQKEGLDIVEPGLDEFSGETVFKTVKEIGGAEEELFEHVPLMFYPLYQEDAGFDAVFAYEVEEVILAAYGSRSHRMIVNMEHNESLRFVACGFIHELGHAQIARNEKRIRKDSSFRSNEERLLEEVRVQTVDYRLHLALGGERYRAAVEIVVQKIRARARGKAVCIRKVGIGKALDEIFQVAPSHEAQVERDGTFLVHCYLMYADRFLSKLAAEEYKRKILAPLILSGYEREKLRLGKAQ